MASAGQIFYCNNCRSDVTDLRLKCAVCTDFDLCLQCFACGAEAGGHKKYHDYYFVHFGNKPLFSNQKLWKAKEEIQLLDKVTRYGFGNWEKVAEIMETKTAAEVEEHFVEMYINGNIGQATLPLVQPPQITDHTEPINEMELSSHKTVNAKLSEEACSEIGYMPNRDDFEEEYDNGAEALVLPLSENEDDDDVQVALKLACIDIYRNRLRERHRMKKLVRDYDLVAHYTSSDAKSSKEKCDKEESDLKNKMKVFSRLQSAADQESLLSGMMKERKLKSKIRDLGLQYNKKHPKDGSKVDQAKMKLKKFKENKHRKGAACAVGKGSPSTCTKKEEKSSGNGQSHEKVTPKEEMETSEAPDGLELLSRTEKKLCANLGLDPAGYIALKIVLLKEQTALTETKATKAVTPAGLSKNDVQKVTSFMVTSGWITAG